MSSIVILSAAKNLKIRDSSLRFTPLHSVQNDKSKDFCSGLKLKTPMKWCDLSCEHASFPKVQAVDGAGSCRTFQALHCAKLGRLVYKNAPCPCAEPAADRGEKGSE